MHGMANKSDKQKRIKNDIVLPRVPLCNTQTYQEISISKLIKINKKWVKHGFQNDKIDL